MTQSSVREPLGPGICKLCTGFDVPRRRARATCTARSLFISIVVCSSKRLVDRRATVTVDSMLHQPWHQPWQGGCLITVATVGPPEAASSFSTAAFPAEFPVLLNTKVHICVRGGKGRVKPWWRLVSPDGRTFSPLLSVLPTTFRKKKKRKKTFR